jgi:hypothetical protein
LKPAFGDWLRTKVVSKVFGSLIQVFAGEPYLWVHPQLGANSFKA